MFNIRKDDIVQVNSGKDKGKKGKVLRTFPKLSKALVEGINMLKKNRRKTQQDQQGGIIDLEMPINLSNLFLLCKSCNQPTRVGVKIGQDGSKNRFCKKCEAVI